MVMPYGPNDRNFPGLDRVFPEGQIRRIRGIRLAHLWRGGTVSATPRLGLSARRIAEQGPASPLRGVGRVRGAR